VVCGGVRAASFSVWPRRLSANRGGATRTRGMTVGPRAPNVIKTGHSNSCKRRQQRQSVRGTWKQPL
jgi:hypothetical protein